MQHKIESFNWKGKAEEWEKVFAAVEARCPRYPKADGCDIEEESVKGSLHRRWVLDEHNVKDSELEIMEINDGEHQKEVQAKPTRANELDSIRLEHQQPIGGAQGQQPAEIETNRWTQIVVQHDLQLKG